MYAGTQKCVLSYRELGLNVKECTDGSASIIFFIIIIIIIINIIIVVIIIVSFC